MKDERNYTVEFYKRQSHASAQAARLILPLVLPLIKPHAVVDVGGGTGGWANACRDMGVKSIMVLDGPYVPEEFRLVPPECFHEVDLLQPLPAHLRGDLAICLEVAEHLPASRADGFVSDLTRLADAVLFSAAIPGQGGANHLNEQWPDYWVRRFQANGHDCFDMLRMQIWKEPRIPFWYRQNAILFVRVGSPAYQSVQQVASPTDANPLVHPELYRAFRDLTLTRRINRRLAPPIRQVYSSVRRLRRRGSEA